MSMTGFEPWTSTSGIGSDALPTEPHHCPKTDFLVPKPCRGPISYSFTYDVDLF